MTRIRIPRFAPRLAASLAMLVVGTVQAGCLPAGYDQQQLAQLPSYRFSIADAPTRHTLAIDLSACLGDPDPAVRDGLAFTSLAHWLRGGELDSATRLALHDKVLAQLRDGRDPGGFRRPFAALVLSELARADRIDPVLDADRRKALLDATIEWYRGIVDYRGYSDREGWRHGVAHGADLILQLGLNPEVGRDDVVRLMDALASRIAPAAPVSYVHGEAERLARVVYFVHDRGVLEAAWWTAWFARIAAPAPLSAWSESLRSERGLAKRHNTVAFLHAVTHAARVGRRANDARLLEDADRALLTVHGG